MKKKISIVIPVHNEERNIIPLFAEIRQALHSVDYEVIYVDDHSTDKTQTILSGLCSEFLQARAIRLNNRCGQSAALRVGVHSARYPIVISMDGDGQNDPADIEKFLDHFTAESVTSEKLLLIGYRHIRFDSHWRRIISRIANKIRNALLHDKTPDSGCGIKAFPRDFYLALPQFNHMHRFLPALVQQHGGTVQSILVNHRKRSTGRSHYGTLDRMLEGILDLIGVAWLGKRSMAPEIEKEIG